MTSITHEVREFFEKKLAKYTTKVEQAKARISRILQNYVKFTPLLDDLVNSMYIAVVKDLQLRISSHACALTITREGVKIPAIIFDLKNALDGDDKSVFISVLHEFFHHVLGHTSANIPDEVIKHPLIMNLVNYVADAQVNKVIDYLFSKDLGDVYTITVYEPISREPVIYAKTVIRGVAPEDAVAWMTRIYEMLENLVKTYNLSVSLDPLKPYLQWEPPTPEEVALANEDVAILAIKVYNILRRIAEQIATKTGRDVDEVFDELCRKCEACRVGVGQSTDVVEGISKRELIEKVREVLRREVEEAAKKISELRERWFEEFVKELEEKLGRKLTDEELRRAREEFEREFGRRLGEILKKVSPVTPPLIERDLGRWREEVSEHLREYSKEAGVGVWYYDKIGLPRRYRRVISWIDYLRSTFGALASRVRYLWWRPARKYIEYYERFGVVVPEEERERLLAAVWLIVDTSGSVMGDSKVLNFFLERILELTLAHNLTLYVVFFASEAIGPYRLTPGNVRDMVMRAREIKVVTGGTEVRFAFERVLGITKPRPEEKAEKITLKEVPSTVILLTDGYIADAESEYTVSLARKIKQIAYAAISIYTDNPTPDVWNWTKIFVHPSEVYQQIKIVGRR